MRWEHSAYYLPIVLRISTGWRHYLVLSRERCPPRSQRPSSHRHSCRSLLVRHCRTFLAVSHPNLARFARVIYLNEEHENVHVQWFEHSSKTFLQELGHSQELFLTNQCDMQRIEHIIGKVDTHYIKPDQSLAEVKPHDFFYRYKPNNYGRLALTFRSRYLWDDYEGTFTNVDVDALAASAREPPPDNCPVCETAAKFDQGLQAEKIHLGVRWHGVEYHLDDCVFIKADEGPCHIGQITNFIHGRSEGHSVKVVVRLFGRTDKIGSRPDTTLKDGVRLLPLWSISSFTSLRLETFILYVRRDDDPH